MLLHRLGPSLFLSHHHETDQMQSPLGHQGGTVCRELRPIRSLFQQCCLQLSVIAHGYIQKQVLACAGYFLALAAAISAHPKSSHRLKLNCWSGAWNSFDGCIQGSRSRRGFPLFYLFSLVLQRPIRQLCLSGSGKIGNRGLIERVGA